MNILLISGGSGNDALVKGLKKLYPESNVKVLVNAYDAGKSTGICRKITNTLGVSDIRKNHSRMYKAITPIHELNQCLIEFYESRYNFTKGHELEEVIEKLNAWSLDQLIPFAKNFFKRPQVVDYNFTDFNVSNIIYSEMYAEFGYETTNKFFTNLLQIDDFVILNSFDNVYIQAVTQDGSMIKDEGDIVEYKNAINPIISLKYVSSDNNTLSGLNPAAIEAISNADLIVISTGTFWSSIYPTLDYEDLYKFINTSSASKIWAMNNTEDKDSYGVGSNDFINILSNKGLDLTQFTILENLDAVESLKQDNDHVKIVKASMGCINGKHNGEKYATEIFKIYYGLTNVDRFKKIIFDFDDTLWSRDPQFQSSSVENINLLNKIAENCCIVSGNSYESIRKKLSTVYGTDLTEFNVDIWADANACLFRNNKKIKVIPELTFHHSPDKLIQHLHEIYGLNCVPNDNEIITCLKIKPLSQLDQCLLANYLNDYLLTAAGLVDCCASPTGTTTVDIVSKKNNKSCVLPYISDSYQDILYIGDEIDSGNDQQIAQLCGQSIHTKNIKETTLVIRLIINGLKK